MGLKQELPLQRRDSSDCLTLGVSGGEVTQLNGLTILISAATGLSSFAIDNLPDIESILNVTTGSFPKHS